MNPQETDTLADPIIDHATRAARAMLVPAGPPAAVLEQVRRAGAQPVTQVVRAPARWRFTPLTQYAAAAAILIIFAGSLFMLNRAQPGGSHAGGGAGIAFADVLQQLQQVHTVSYRTLTRQKGMPDTITRDTVDMAGKFSRSEFLARDPKAAQAAELICGVSIYNQGKMLNLDLEAKTAHLTDYTTADGLPHQLAETHTLADIQKLSPLNAKPLGDRTFDGKKLTGFRVQRDYDKFNQRALDVWVDPATRLPVRVEETTARREPDAAALAALADKPRKDGVIQLTPEDQDRVMESWPEIMTTRIMSEIVFDQVVDEAAFSLDPPKGYTLTVTKIAGPTAPAPPTSEPPAPRRTALGTPPMSTSFVAADFTIDQQIAMAPLIIRARVTAWEGTVVHYDIARIIYGHTDDKTFDYDLSYGDPSILKSLQNNARQMFEEAKHRAPTDDELAAQIMTDHNIAKGRDVIIFLAPNSTEATGGRKYHVTAMAFDNPGRPVDQWEDDIVAGIERGDYLDIYPGFQEAFQAASRDSEAIVRANLVATDAAAATWKITRSLRGNITTPLVVVPHDVYRRRAQAIAAHAALKDSSLSNPQALDKRIQSEMDKLLKAELTPNREAILFLKDCKTKEGTETTSAALRARAFDDPEHKRLDTLEQALVNAPVASPR